jgi:hypothetical protein
VWVKLPGQLVRNGLEDCRNPGAGLDSGHNTIFLLRKFCADNLIVTADSSCFAIAFKKTFKSYCVLKIALLELVSNTA